MATSSGTGRGAFAAGARADSTGIRTSHLVGANQRHAARRCTRASTCPLDELTRRAAQRCKSDRPDRDGGRARPRL